jgi:hypothetical protein
MDDVCAQVIGLEHHPQYEAEQAWDIGGQSKQEAHM